MLNLSSTAFPKAYFWITRKPPRKWRKVYNKLTSKITGVTTLSRIVSNDFKLSQRFKKAARKILFSPNINKATWIDKTSAKYLKDGVTVLAHPLRNMISLLPEECKIVKLKPLLRKVQALILKSINLLHFFYLPKLAEKSTEFQLQWITKDSFSCISKVSVKTVWKAFVWLIL